MISFFSMRCFLICFALVMAFGAAKWHSHLSAVVDEHSNLLYLITYSPPITWASWKFKAAEYCSMNNLIQLNSLSRYLRLISALFWIRSLKELMSSFNSTANLLLEHLDTMADGKTEVCMIDQFANAALDVICKVKFRVIVGNQKQYLNHVVVGWVVSCSAFGLFFFSFCR